ncbi:putative sulfate exporter family transporter [Halostagnicola sp. A56]|uniref:putative sulfate exporter family transporter n=1 Tax=Halostagnicola sp. A56 TaxID=1495067 RepID=UPI0009E4B165|nr:putative sulfate exporter family transporter [Halostagnicola sp. A56]
MVSLYKYNPHIETLAGIAILSVGAVGSWALAHQIPGADELLIAIFIGVILTNTIGIPEWASKGIQTHKIWLGSGIVLMGVSLTLDQIIDRGVFVIISVISFSILTILSIELLSRLLFDFESKFAT